jgi:hypothetical protein
MLAKREKLLAKEVLSLIFQGLLHGGSHRRGSG